MAKSVHAYVRGNMANFYQWLAAARSASQLPQALASPDARIDVQIRDLDHIAALPGSPYEGHTLGKVIPALEAQIGGSIARVVADAGYRGHNAPDGYRLKVYTSGQKRNVTQALKRDLRRRSAVEPVIGHLKAEHRMDRNYLAHRTGDAINAVLAAVGYNFRLLLKWLAILCAQILAALFASFVPKNQPSTA